MATCKNSRLGWCLLVLSNVLYICVLIFFIIFSLFSLDWTDYQWIRIGDEGVTVLADPRVFKNFKTLK